MKAAQKAKRVQYWIFETLESFFVFIYLKLDLSVYKFSSISRTDLELDFGGGHNPELDFGGHNCLYRVKSFLTLLFAIGNIAIWGTMAPRPPWIRPRCRYVLLATLQQFN